MSRTYRGGWGHLRVLWSWWGRQQELGQGVAQPVLVVVGAPSSMAGEFGVCVGIGEGTVVGGGVCGAHSFAEGSVAEQHGNVGGLVPVATLTVCGDEFGQGGVGGAGVSRRLPPLDGLRRPSRSRSAFVDSQECGL